jgi:hypothetical protein
MGRLVLNIPDELEKKFREAVYKRYGMKKGNITRAIVEALEMWVVAVNRKEVEADKVSIGQNQGGA